MAKLTEEALAALESRLTALISSVGHYGDWAEVVHALVLVVREVVLDWQIRFVELSTEVRSLRENLSKLEGHGFGLQGKLQTLEGQKTHILGRVVGLENSLLQLKNRVKGVIGP